MGDCNKICYICDADTKTHCMYCIMPVCVKCVPANTTKHKNTVNTMCKWCEINQMRYRIYRWCGICGVLTDKYKKFSVSYPISYYAPLDGITKPMCTSSVYLSICNECINAYPWVCKIFDTTIAKKFIAQNAKQMITSINSIRKY